MAGEVTLIAKIAPQNDAFTGLVDAKHVIGGASNTLPDATVAESNVTQHQAALDVSSQFDTYLATKSTTNLSEGTNLYFTDERAQDSIGGILVDSSEIDFTYNDATPSITASLVAGSIDETKLDASVNASLDLADSSVQLAFKTIAVSGQSDVVADSATDTLTLIAGSNISITTNATNDSITITSTGGSLSDADYGDITVSSSGAVMTIDNDVVTFAKMQNITTDRLLGRDTVGAGDIEELTVGGGIEFTGTGIQTSAFTGDATKTAGGTTLTLATVNSNVGSFGSASQVVTFTVNAKGLITAASNTPISITSSAVSDFNEAAQDAIGAMIDSSLVYVDATPTLQRAALTGDVTASAGSNATTIASGAVSLSKMASLTASTIIGNNTGISATPIALTVSQVKTMLSLDLVENTALSTWTGSTNITTLGTIGTGTWNATTISIAKGGTGATSASSAFDALSGMTTLGDTIYGGDSGTRTRLAGNTTTTRKFLRQTGDGVNSAAPAWDTVTNTDVGLSNVTNVAQMPLSYLDTDTTLSANSDVKVPSQKAAKAYIDGIIAAANATVYKGVIDCSTNPNYPAADAGWLYRISVAGKIGGASGVNVEAGDMIICLTDGTSAGTQASVGSSWNVIQSNIDGAVVGPSSATDGNIVLFDGTTGKLVKNSSYSPSSFEVPLTFSTGLTRSTNTITVNTTQNIAKLSNLTSNGFVKTSGGDGTLSIDTSTYLTANQTITLSGDVSGSGSTSISVTIGNNAVTLEKMATMATASLLGRNTAGTGNVEVLSSSTVKTLLSLNNVENTALSTWAGTSNITTLGTVATGTWDATTIGISKGGTGQTTANAGFNALSPMTTLGDTIYGGASGAGTRLAGNTTTTRKFKMQQGDGVNSAAPIWDTVTKSDVGLGSVENTALSTWTGSSNITTLGTIGTGVWQGTAIADSYISSSSTWNAKESALTFDAPLSRSTNTISLTQSGIDHGSIGGLADDDHTQYALLLGRSGGQTIYGGTAASNGLTLLSTSNATKGKITLGTTCAFNESTGGFSVGTTSGTSGSLLTLQGSAAIDGSAPITMTMRSTRNSSSWTADAAMHRIDFYNEDLSNPAVAARIETMVSSSSGGGVGLRFFTNGGTLTEAFRFSKDNYFLVGTSTIAAYFGVQAGASAGNVITGMGLFPHTSDLLGCYDGNTASLTYAWSRSSTTVTVTVASTAQLLTGMKILVSSSSDTSALPNGTYAITVATATTFTIIGVNAGGTTGTCAIQRQSLRLRPNGALVLGSNTSSTVARMLIETENTTRVGLAIDAIASQSSDLLQARNSSGTAMSLISATGDIKTNVAGVGYYVKEGTNACMGVATLVAGTVTVSTTKVTANSRIFLTAQSNSGTEYGLVKVSARTASTSFTITSYRGNNTTTVASNDTSTVAWIIFEPS